VPFGPCPKHGCFEIVGGIGLVARRGCKGMRYFVMRYSDEMSCFLAVMRFHCEIVCVLLHNFRTR
jgi:hypothetical protein